MTQKEFVKAIAADVNKKYELEGKKKLTDGNVSDVVGSMVKVTTGAVANGDKIQISGLGTFESAHRDARDGRNPITGETIRIEAKNVPKFKAAKAFKDIMNK